MKGFLKGLMRYTLLLMMILPSILLPYDQVQAKEQETPRVLRVAFPELDGFTQTDQNGGRHGIVVDYLNEIAKYTGWKYEYIETNGETMLDEFLDGKFDLMGGTYYIEGFEKYFAYPNYNTGYSKSLLVARKDDESIKIYDWKSMSGKTIGVYESAKENIRRLKEFIKINAIDCTIKYFKKDQLVNGNLFPYLESGEVDMLLGNNSDHSRAFRTVAEFDSQPHYIVTEPDSQDILDGLNMALEKIADSNPNFSKERYNANFKNSNITSIFLNEEEKNYIKEKQTVSVAVVKDWHPLFCLESENKLHNGLIPDMLKKIQEFTGLEFTYEYADSYAKALELVQQGKADMLGSFLGSEEDCAQMELALTKPYATLSDIMVRNKSVSFPSDGLVGGILEGKKMPKSMETAEVKYFQKMADGIQAVNRGDVDFFYGLSPGMEQEIQSHHYANVVPNTLINDRNEIGFAMIRPAEADLLTIMNKAINTLSSEEKDMLTNQNMISVGIGSFSIIEMIYANPFIFIVILTCIFLIVAISVLIVARSRVHAAKMQSSLEKAEASSRAKGEFLSRMSHEIRTPMNAIVGLSDLTCMIEGVPENVRGNLHKMRSSCHYLLNLISDILDMSRIESGMMTIANEPFSIGVLVDELKSMMTADAKRRGLEFIVEEKIQNDTLIGDPVRLKQVLMNLSSNAFKFTPAGGKVQIYVTETDSSKENATYHFQVIDNGIGISEENQKRIFESFEQIGSNYSKSQGTGLGLAISKTIVKLMGGELMLQSELEKGSEFYFTVSFPIGVSEERPKEPQRKQDLEHMSILLAEDNDINAEIAEELLKLQGATVRRAENGKIAVEMFEESRPGEIQVILMDIQMPVMDGKEACRVIRKMERLDAAEIPIIAMTANSFKEDSDAAMEAGMNGFITKPVDVNVLYRELYKVAKKTSPD